MALLAALPAYTQEQRIALAVGSSLSAASSLFVLLSFQYWPESQRHPASLICARSLFDLALSVTWLATLFNDPLNCGSPQGMASAFMTEFFILASEVVTACLSFDLLIHAGNPFSDFRSNNMLFALITLAISLGGAFLLISNPDWYGPSFLPVCWTKFDKDKDISGANDSMILFFYGPWLACFIVSITGIARASVFLGGAKKDARAVALRDARRSVLAHTLYWGTLLTVYSPLVNLAYQEGKSTNDYPALVCAVLFILGARAVENGLVWYPHLISVLLHRSDSAMMDYDLSPVLNEPLQREILWATVEGLARLVKTPDPMISARRTVVRLDDDGDSTSLSMEKRVLFLAIAPMLVASASAGVTAIVVKAIDSYLAVVMLGFSLFILGTVALSWTFASYQRQDRTIAVVIEHAPYDFMRIRALLGLSDDELVDSLRSAADVKSRAKFSTSGGRSGAFVFPTPDGKFILKTISQGERRVLLRLLPSLLTYLRSLERGPKACMLARVFGVFSVTMHGRTLVVAVMENLLSNMAVADQRFDLKGSWINRSAEVLRRGRLCVCVACGRPFAHAVRGQICALNREGHVARRLLKDNDFRQSVLMPVSAIRELRAQINHDTGFLALHSIMDYSFLLCVHRRVVRTGEDVDEEVGARLVRARLLDTAAGWRFGIVDWFTEYSMSKRLEQWYKVYVCCNVDRDEDGFRGVSAVDPEQYRARFLKRVVHVVFRDLSNVVQIFRGDRPDFAVGTLDVSGVKDLTELRRLVSRTLPDLRESDLLYIAGAGDNVFDLQKEFNQAMILCKEEGLCRLIIVNKDDV